MATVEHEALSAELRDFLAQAGPFDKPIPVALTPQQQAELAAAGVTITPGMPVVVHISRPRIVVPVTPDMGCISEAQCVELAAMVRAIVDQHRAPYQSVWTLLNQHCGVRSYRLIHAAAAPRAVAFLQHWIDTGLPPAE